MLGPTATQETAEKILDLERERQELFSAVGDYLDEENQGDRLSSKIAERRTPLIEYIDQYNILLDKELEILDHTRRIVSLEKDRAVKKVEADGFPHGVLKIAASAQLQAIEEELKGSKIRLQDMLAQVNEIEREVNTKHTAYKNYTAEKAENANVVIISGADGIIAGYNALNVSKAALEGLIPTLKAEKSPGNHDETAEKESEIEGAATSMDISTKPIRDFKTLHHDFNANLKSFYVSEHDNTPEFERDYDADLGRIRDLSNQLREIMAALETKDTANEKIIECGKLNEDFFAEITGIAARVGGHKQDANILKRHLEEPVRDIAAAENTLLADLKAAKDRAEKRPTLFIFVCTAVYTGLALAGVCFATSSDLSLYYAVNMALPVLLAILAMVHVMLTSVVRRRCSIRIRLHVLQSFNYVLLTLCTLTMLSIVVSESDALSVRLSAAGLSIIVFKTALFFFRKPIATSSSVLERIYKFCKTLDLAMQFLFAGLISGILVYNGVQSGEWMTIFPPEHISVIAILLSAIAVIETRNINRDVVRSRRWIAFFVTVLGAISYHSMQTSITLRAPDVMDIRTKLARYAV